MSYLLLLIYVYLCVPVFNHVHRHVGAYTDLLDLDL